LGDVETRKREKEHAVKRHKAPKVSLPRGILSLDHVGSALETNIFFPAVLFVVFLFSYWPEYSQFGVAFLGTRVYSINSRFISRICRSYLQGAVLSSYR
jgi:hypothetical protein